MAPVIASAAMALVAAVPVALVVLVLDLVRTGRPAVRKVGGKVPPAEDSRAEGRVEIAVRTVVRAWARVVHAVIDVPIGIVISVPRRPHCRKSG